MLYILLVIAAIILFFMGVVRLVERQYLLGALFIIAAFLVGPGGISIF